MNSLTNYCDKCGNCSRCGNCCAALLPITRKEEKKIREYIKENKIEPEFFQTNKDINLQCCFYDRKNKLCKIYEVRPSICKSFRCNKNELILEQEKMKNHERAYWNRMVNDKLEHLTDMRLLFYDDPRSLVANLIYSFYGKMEITEEQLELVKKCLKKFGHSELASCINGVIK